MPQVDLAVVGGGIAGLCLALALQNHPSLKVTLYEAAPAFGEIGAGVAFGPNAVRAMGLISQELVDGFRKCATGNLSPEYANQWFSFRVGMDGKSEDARNRGVTDSRYLCSVEEPEPRSGLVNRSQFLDVLIALLPKTFGVFGKTLDDITDEGTAGVILHFEDGTEARHSAVIGCDGIKSQVRKFITKGDPAKRATFTGKYCYRGMIPMDKALKSLNEELAYNCQAYLGYGGHILTFPVAKGRFFNVVAFNSQTDWPHERMVVSTTKEQMTDSYQGWGKHVLSILEMLQTFDIWALYDSPPLDSYAVGRVCVMGDAAHASTPFQGAGAGMAIEDAYVLGKILMLLDDESQIPAAFRAFDGVRRERTQRLVASSRESGRIWHFEQYGDDLEKIKDVLGPRMSWIWEHDFEGDLEAAKGIFAKELQNDI